MAQLRDPETGCAWDIKQTFQTIAPHTIEEAYEVADAIERNNLTDLKEELGDLLFQVIYHSQMASEQGAFVFDDVASAVAAKLVSRHPHVFGDTKAMNADEVKAIWEAQKAKERAANPQNEDASALASITRALPALMRAEKMQSRAAQVGFDWPDVKPVWSKLDEEIAEVREAVANEDQSAVEDEVGDLLFTVVNLARHLKVDPEAALAKSSRKFEQRFRQVEVLAQALSNDDTPVDLKAMDLNALDALWEKAKTLT